MTLQSMGHFLKHTFKVMCYRLEFSNNFSGVTIRDACDIYVDVAGLHHILHKDCFFLFRLASRLEILPLKFKIYIYFEMWDAIVPFSI